MINIKIALCLLSIAISLVTMNTRSNRNRILDLENKMESFEFRLNALLGCQAGLKKENFHLRKSEVVERKGIQHD